MTVVLEDPAVAIPPKIETPFRRFASEFFESWIARIALFTLLGIIALALLAPWITPQNPYDLGQVSVMDGRLAAGVESLRRLYDVARLRWRGARSLFRHPLRPAHFSVGRRRLRPDRAGDRRGVGLLAAYAGGRVETVIMRLVDLQLSFPAALTALILIAILGKGVDKIIIALVLVQWAYYARTVRGSALVERRKEYIEAASCLGLSHKRIVFRHIMPNCLAPLIVVGTVQTAHAIALEATLVLPRRRPAADRAEPRCADRERVSNTCCPGATGSACFPASRCC